MVVVAVMPVARAAVLPVPVKVALAEAIAVVVLPMLEPANSVGRPAKVLVTSAKVALMTALPVRARHAATLHRVESSRPALRLAHRVVTSRHAVISLLVPMPVLHVLTLPRARILRHVPTSLPGSQHLASLRALPNPATAAKCLCRVMRKSVLREVRVDKL